MSNRIRIFKNKNKTEDRHPDLRILWTDNEEVAWSGGAWRHLDKNGDTIYTGELQKEEIEENFDPEQEIE